MAALDAAPEGSKPLLIGDLNSDLDFPRDRQEEILAADLEERGLRCVTRGFSPRRTRWTRGRWTWRQRRTLQSGERVLKPSKQAGLLPDARSGPGAGAAVPMGTTAAP